MLILVGDPMFYRTRGRLHWYTKTNYFLILWSMVSCLPCVVDVTCTFVVYITCTRVVDMFKYSIHNTVHIVYCIMSSV